MTDLTEPARPAVTYEELAELESEFDDIETEISKWSFLASLSCLHGQAEILSLGQSQSGNKRSSKHPFTANALPWYPRSPISGHW